MHNGSVEYWAVETSTNILLGNIPRLSLLKIWTKTRWNLRNRVYKREDTTNTKHLLRSDDCMKFGWSEEINSIPKVFEKPLSTVWCLNRSPKLSGVLGANRNLFKPNPDMAKRFWVQILHFNELTFLLWSKSYSQDQNSIEISIKRDSSGPNSNPHLDDGWRTRWPNLLYVICMILNLYN